MKIRTLLLTLICLSFHSQISLAQCPDNITFSTQGQIDSFQINYPGCTEIMGNVIINGSDIINLNGLDSLVSIGGCLKIENNPLLANLDGLQSLVSIGKFGMPNGDSYSEWGLSISNNTALISLSGLDSLMTVEGCVDIRDNYSLTSISSLIKLSSIGTCSFSFITGGGVASISIGRSSLKSLDGLQNIDSLAGYFSIYDNDSLASLSSLENLVSALDFFISGNEILESLNGLQNVTAIRDLSLENNPSLNSIESLQGTTSLRNLLIDNNPSLGSIESLSEITSLGDLEINRNPSLNSLNGLNNLSVVNDFTLENNSSLTTLAGLEKLDSIHGCCYILNNSDLISLNGLDALKYIGGCAIFIFPQTFASRVNGLHIVDNSSLTDLGALENINRLKRLVIKNNNSLSSLNGLGGLEMIDTFEVNFRGNGALEIEDNPSLTSLSELSNLSSVLGDFKVKNTALISMNGLEDLSLVGGDLDISDNGSLASLSGLDNIDPSEIDELSIENNIALSLCEILSICGYLENGGEATISGNALGCNSEEEVEEACDFVPTREELPENNRLKIFPNPATHFLSIELPKSSTQPIEINIYDLQGKLMSHQILSDRESIDLHGFPTGMYLVKAVIGEQVYSSKFVKN